MGYINYMNREDGSMNVLILTANDPRKKSGWEEELKKCGNVKMDAIYEYHSNMIIRIVRKLHGLIPIPGYQIWYGSWWKNLKDTDVMIAIAYDSTYRMFKIIKKKFPHIRRILYWWDPVENTIQPDRVSEEICERWTFSKTDAERFGIKYNSQFYAHGLPEYPFRDEIRYDVMFFGAGGGRLYKRRVELLEQFYSVCVEKGLKTCFGVKYISDKSDEKKPFAIEKRVEEDEYINIALHSKAILDLTEPGNEWTTVRPIEALFLRKKLITNNCYIVNEELYDPQNVFLMGKDSYDNLKEFLNTPVKEMPKAVYDFYSTKAWLERFS